MKKVLLSFFIIIFLVFVGVYFYLNNTKPQYDGQLVLSGLASEVIVKFDQNGVPHIYAENRDDAYYSLGYLQAQDRLF